MAKEKIILTEEEIDRIVEMAWEDRTPFDAIYIQFGLREQDVIKLMRREMKTSSFKMWRSRVQGRKTKHNKITPLARPKNAPKIWSKRFEYLRTKGYMKILLRMDKIITEMTNGVIQLIKLAKTSI